MKPIKLVKINSEKIINPATVRQVLINGKIGKELTKGQKGKDYIFVNNDSQKDSKKKLVECVIKQKEKE